MDTHKVMPLRSLGVGKFEPLPKSIQTELFPTLKHKDVVRMGVEGEGSCFYHSMCAALNYDNYIAADRGGRKRIGQEFRCEFQSRMTPTVWESMKKRFPQHARRDFASLKESFCSPSTWAQEDDIKIVSEFMGLNVVFLDATRDKFYCFIHGKPSSDETVVIAWIDHSHFEPILRVRKRCADHAHLQGRFSPQQDTEIVDGLRGAFATHCKPFKKTMDSH